MCAIIVCVVVQLLAFPVPKYNMMFGANAVRAFRTFSAKLVKANPLCTARVRILVCFHPSFLCVGINLSAWAIPPSKEQLKGQEPAGISPFSFQAANTAGAPQM